MAVDAVLRRVATVVTLACAALVALTVLLLFRPTLRATFGFETAAGPAYRVGDRVDVPPDLYDSSAATVLIFARSTCGACQRATTELAAVVARLRTIASVRITLVAAANRADDELAFARAIGLNGDERTTIAVTGLRLRVVPTVLVVDRAGVIRYSSEGGLTPKQQDDILRAATGPASMR